MKKRSRLLKVLAILALALVAALGGLGCGYLDTWIARGRIKDEIFTPRESPPARLEVKDNIPILHLYGTPEEMGTQYGTILKGALKALNTYTTYTLPPPPAAIVNRVHDFARSVEPKLPDSIRTELQAVSKASGVPYIDLVELNVVPRVRCSTLAVWGEATAGRPLLLGRNSEYPDFGLADRGSLVIVRHPAAGIPTVSVGFLGMVGTFTGVNRDGVFFANLLVFNAREDNVRSDGLPIQIALRLAGERCSTMEEMATFLRARKGMIPMNVILADSKEALLLELGLSASEVRRGDHGVLAASNHFRTPSLRADEVNCPRYASLIEAVRTHGDRFDLAAMKDALFAARMENINLQAVVFEPATMTLHVSVNRVPAAAGPYTAFNVRDLLGTR